MSTLMKLNRIREIALAVYNAAPYWGTEDIIKFNKAMNFIERLMRGWKKIYVQHDKITNIYYTRHNSKHALKVSFPTLREDNGVLIIEVIRKEEGPKKLA